MGNKYVVWAGKGLKGYDTMTLRYSGDSLLKALYIFFTIKIDKHIVYWKSLERR
jgi:hypothetical protein